MTDRPYIRILVCGDRNWDDGQAVWDTLSGLNHKLWPNSLEETITVISGMARGADTDAAEWARANHIKLEEYPVQWDKYHRAAGPIRNQQMLDEGKPDVVYAFHDDLENSKGTKDMVKRAVKAGIPVYNIRRFVWGKQMSI